MNEERNYRKEEIESIFAKLEKYAGKLTPEEQDKFYHAGIAGYLSTLLDVLPPNMYEGAKQVARSAIKYHLEKAGLEAKVVKEEDKLQSKDAKEKQGNLPYALPKNQANQSYDNPPTDVPLAKPSGAGTSGLVDDDIPF